MGHLNGPGGTILNELRKDSRYQWVKPKYPILYLLEAIMGKSDLEEERESHKAGPPEPLKGLS